MGLHTHKVSLEGQTKYRHFWERFWISCHPSTRSKKDNQKTTYTKWICLHFRSFIETSTTSLKIRYCFWCTYGPPPCSILCSFLGIFSSPPCSGEPPSGRRNDTPIPQQPLSLSLMWGDTASTSTSMKYPCEYLARGTLVPWSSKRVSRKVNFFPIFRHAAGSCR